MTHPAGPLRHTPEVTVALDVLRAAGWHVREDRTFGDLMDVGDLVPGGIVWLRYGGEGTVHLRTVIAQPWQPQPHEREQPGEPAGQ